MRKSRASKSPKALNHLQDGPWAGHCIALTVDAGSSTGWLQIGGEIGRYCGSVWQRMEG